MPRCSHNSCEEEARFRPAFVLVFTGSAVWHRVRLDMLVCPKHRREMRATFASERGRELVERALKERSKGPLDWQRCRLWFEIAR